MSAQLSGRTLILRNQRSRLLRQQALDFRGEFFFQQSVELSAGGGRETHVDLPNVAAAILEKRRWPGIEIDRLRQFGVYFRLRAAKQNRVFDSVSLHVRVQSGRVLQLLLFLEIQRYDFQARLVILTV